MDRPRRIRIVAGIGLGLFALFVAYLGTPLAAMFVWPTPDVSGDMDSMMDSFAQTSRAATIANRISLGALVFAVFSFAYVLVDVAIWFIGPPESDTDTVA